MTAQITVFLSSRLEGMRELRRAVTRRFACDDARAARFRLQDFDSVERGKPRFVDFSLREAERCDVFVLLMSPDYPTKNLEPLGKLISHAEYLKAMERVSPPPTFVFMPGGLDGANGNPLLAQWLERIESNRGPRHGVYRLDKGDEAARAEFVFQTVSRQLAEWGEFHADAAGHAPFSESLELLTMSAETVDDSLLPDVMDRVRARNEEAREAFRKRRVPEEPFARKLFRPDDVAGRQIEDFDTRLAEARGGKVFGIVSPSGMGKSTFIADFASRLKEDEFMLITGREFDASRLDEAMMDVAHVAKVMARRARLDPAASERRFFLFVDAMNEISGRDDLLKSFIERLECLLEFSRRCLWPLVIVLTMRPELRKAIPELRNKLISHANVYDLHPFGEPEYVACAARNDIRTRYADLGASMREYLRDPLLLGIVGDCCQGREIPPEFGEVDLVRMHLNWLAEQAEPKLAHLESWSRRLAGGLLTQAEQELAEPYATELLANSELRTLVDAGVLTDRPDGGGTELKYGFRYDRVAHYFIGQHVAESLVAAEARGKQGLAMLAEYGESGTRLEVEKLAGIHWSGLSLGVCSFVLDDPTKRWVLLFELFASGEPSWRMLARAVLLQAFAGRRREDDKTVHDVLLQVVAAAEKAPNRSRLRAELVRAVFEVVRLEAGNLSSRGPAHQRAFEPLIEYICRGLNSSDQETADVTVSAVAILMAREDLVPMLLRALRREVDAMQLMVVPSVARMMAMRGALAAQRFLGSDRARGRVAVPMMTAVKLLIVCFGSTLNRNAYEACVTLLGHLLRRLGRTPLGRIVGTAPGRAVVSSFLSTMLNVAMHTTLMPVNAREWRALCADPVQTNAFLKAVQWCAPGVTDFDADWVVSFLSEGNPNPFAYQFLLTALSTRFELAKLGFADAAVPDKTLRTVERLIEADRGDGTCKYVASLILYHVNSFGAYGNAETARLMTRLSLDILREQEGMLGTDDHRYNSNIVGTTGRSLLRLAERGVTLDQEAFAFIRELTAKVGEDERGMFTTYLFDNLALLAVLVPENGALLRVIKEEVYKAAVDSEVGFLTKAELENLLVKAFARIRASHPAVVDAYLFRRDPRKNSLYRKVRAEHAERATSSTGLDSELVSWAFERVGFELLVHARDFAGKTHARWWKELNSSKRLRASALVQLGFHCLDVGMAWARSTPERKVARTP